MNIVPSNEYLLVMPSGNVKGFDDYAMAERKRKKLQEQKKIMITMMFMRKKRSFPKRL